jgi:hypothetical protein
MLVKGANINIPIFYWILLVPIFLVVSFRRLFFIFEIQYHRLNELEVFGSYVFVLCVSFFEALIYLLLIRFVVFLFKRITTKPNQQQS